MFSGNVGIGIATPGAKLHVLTTSGNSSIYTEAPAGSYGYVRYKSGTQLWDLAVRDNEYSSGFQFRYGGSTPQMIVQPGGNVGIGINPAYKLDVVSGGATTARFGTASADKIVVGGGAGKIDAGTVDPVYTIGGKRYATYMAGMTGVKEETTGIATMARNEEGIYSYVIDFLNQEKGSDLWLFSKTANLKENFAEMVVLLTPELDSRVWYEKDKKNLQVKIFGRASEVSAPSEAHVSYRLTAPRFDSEEWRNTSDAKYEGFNLDKLLK